MDPGRKRCFNAAVASSGSTDTASRFGTDIYCMVTRSSFSVARYALHVTSYALYFIANKLILILFPRYAMKELNLYDDCKSIGETSFI